MPAARIQLGDRAVFNGDWDQALVEYRTAGENSPDGRFQVAAQVGIARTQLLSGDVQAAIGTLESLVQSNTQVEPALTAQAFFFLAQAYSAAERYAEAAERIPAI